MKVRIVPSFLDRLMHIVEEIPPKYVRVLAFNTFFFFIYMDAI